MRVLLTESDPGRGREAESLLSAAGHEVVRCSEHDEPAFPCVGVSEGTCPLDEPTDAVLAVRAHPYPKPQAGEVGVACGVREDVPVVVAGAHGLSPFAPWTAATVEGDDGEDLESALTEASTQVPPALLEAAETEARRLLGEGASVVGHRETSRLVLQVVPPEGSAETDVTAAAVRVLDVVRQVSRASSVVDVGVGDPPEESEAH